MHHLALDGRPEGGQLDRLAGIPRHIDMGILLEVVVQTHSHRIVVVAHHTYLLAVHGKGEEIDSILLAHKLEMACLFAKHTAGQTLSRLLGLERTEAEKGKQKEGEDFFHREAGL
jgi:hypothetical protein